MSSSGTQRPRAKGPDNEAGAIAIPGCGALFFADEFLGVEVEEELVGVRAKPQLVDLLRPLEV